MNSFKEKIKNKIFLAPMAGVTDKAFRELAISEGASGVVTEMVSSKAVVYKNEKTKNIWQKEDSNSAISGLQIFGNDPEIMARAAEMMLSEQHFDFLDINMGCPVKKIIKNKEGSYLMTDPKLASQIVKTIKTRINKPVGVKIRLGMDENNIIAEEFAVRMQDSGADLITLHARTRKQLYSGKARWEYIAKVKSHLEIPLIGNGDISTPEEAGDLLKKKSCDAIMIGRAAMGRPWIFSQIKDFLEKGSYKEEPDYNQRLKFILKQIELMLQYKSERLVVLEMRKHISWYMKALKSVSEIKNQAMRAKNLDELKEILQSRETKI